LSDFNETWDSLGIFWKKYSNIKFHENPFSGGRLVPCGRTAKRTDMTKLIGAFRNFADAPAKGRQIKPKH